jgi:signal transduction histidine kinase
VSERKLLESAILEAVNREQYRIGNDLHDGLGQELTGIALMLRCLAGRLAVEHRTAVPDVESITRLVSNAVESTRSLARGLSPVNLERGGLRDALAGLAMHARSIYGIKVMFNNRLPATMSLDEEVANHLYRIAQEAITNAVKHGQAKIVRLQLSAVQGRVRLSIADDGTGLSADAGAANGMGLRIMRYRARIARGDVRIERSEPNGTRVVCECPIDSRTLEKHRTLRSRSRSVQRIAAQRAVAKTVMGVAKHAKTPLTKSSTKSRRRAKGEFK